MPIFNTAIIGDAQSGKLALIRRQAHQHFDGNTPPYIGNYCENINSSHYIWKTTVLFTHMLLHSNTSGIIIAFDLFQEREKILKSINHWLAFIRKHPVPPNTPIILVGTKLDIEHMNLNPLTNEDLSSFNLPYFKTSASDTTNVNDVFSTMMNAIHSNAIFQPTPEPMIEPIFSIAEEEKKRILIQKLTSYISKISEYKNTDQKYAFGFTFFKTSRAANRRANYKLAKYLKEQLERSTPAHITSLFEKNTLLNSRHKQANKNGNQFLKANCDHGINSTDLNNIIKFARR
jgi:GTPase SAR1 family protein